MQIRATLRQFENFGIVEFDCSLTGFNPIFLLISGDRDVLADCDGRLV